MPVLPYLHHQPDVDPDVRLAPSAVVAGMVAVRAPACLAERAVVRGDQSPVSVGPHAALGAGSTVHVENDVPTRIGAWVWVGPGAVVHATTLGDGVRVEAGAAVLSRSWLGAGSVVSAGSLVTEGASFPDNSYLDGTPARRLRDTTPEERAETRRMVRGALAV